VRRLLVVCLVAFLGLPLVAATPSSLFTKPSVVVYPFTANGSSIDREASSRLATIIATQLAQKGDIAVIPPPPGTERKDFLNVARAHSADYYVAGFISPIGNGVSVVEQVVSTTSGIVVYSTTAQIQTYADAAGQGDDLATFIVRHANRGLAAIGTAPPPSSPSPQPTSEAQTNLGKLFGRKKKPAATPKPAAATTTTAPAAAARNATPTPAAPAAAARATTAPAPLPVAAAAAPATPAPRTVPAAATAAPRTVVAATTPTPAPRAVAAAPAQGYAVLPVSGPGPEAALATQRLIDRTHGERADSAAAACTGHAPHAVLAGTLSVRPDTAFGGHSATFDLHATDCAGKTLWHRSYSNDAGGTQSAQLATERAVEAAIGAYLNPPRKR
jgi:TolB-like protein